MANSLIVVLTVFVYIGKCTAQGFDRNNAFVRILQSCHRESEAFDPCLRNAANSLRNEFKNGIPELDIPPFDPFFIKEVSTTIGGQGIGVKLTLRNVFERGWSTSKVTGLRSNLEAGTLQYYQHFPEKYLDGEYEIQSNIIPPLHNEGRFNLSLFNYTQVTTVRWTEAGKPFKVRIKAIDSGDMKLHLTNLFGGRVIIESVLDRIINVAWRPGFAMLKPVIDDLVSTAFSKLFNDGLANVPFDEIIPK